MLKGVAIVVAGFLSTASICNAQTAGVPEPRRPTQTDLAHLTDLRIALVKAALQLTPEQEKYWPALEEAIRSRSAGRQKRLAALADLRQEQDVDPFKILHLRADNLAERGAELKKLLDAWQPLLPTLSSDQKERMLILGARILGVVRDRMELRRSEMMEDAGENWPDYLPLPSAR
jgi:hypothetical protein